MPENKTEVITIRLTKITYDKLYDRAASDQRSPATMARMLIEKAISMLEQAEMLEKAGT